MQLKALLLYEIKRKAEWEWSIKIKQIHNKNNNNQGKKKSEDGDHLSSFLTYDFMTSDRSPWASVLSFANETRISLLLECFWDEMEYRALRL